MRLIWEAKVGRLENAYRASSEVQVQVQEVGHEMGVFQLEREDNLAAPVNNCFQSRDTDWVGDFDVDRGLKVFSVADHVRTHPLAGLPNMKELVVHMVGHIVVAVAEWEAVVVEVPGNEVDAVVGTD